MASGTGPMGCLDEPRHTDAVAADGLKGMISRVEGTLALCGRSHNVRGAVGMLALAEEETLPGLPDDDKLHEPAILAHGHYRCNACGNEPMGKHPGGMGV